MRSALASLQITRVIAAALLLAGASGCGSDTGATCPPGAFLDPVQAFCVSCPQGTPGYVIHTSQPSAPSGGGGTGSGSGAVDTGVPAADAATGMGDAVTGLDTVMGALTDDGAPTESDGAASGADSGPSGGAGDAVGTGGAGGSGGLGGTGGLGGAGATFPDPPDATGCNCPLAFYCKQLASGPTCVSHSCLNSVPQVQTPGTGGAGADVSGGDAVAPTTDAKVPAGDVVTPGETDL